MSRTAEREQEFLDNLREIKDAIREALEHKEACQVRSLKTEADTICGHLGIKIENTTKDFYYYTADGKGREVEISGLYILGSVSDTIRAVRSIARTFNARVIADFNETPMMSLPRSTQREVFLDWSLKRILRQHPEINA